MQILDMILPYATGAFAIWCAVGVGRTAREIWVELRPQPESLPTPEPVQVPPATPRAYRRAA